MIYQLPSGKVINISTETFCRMTDDDFKYLEEQNFGCSISSDFVTKNLDEIEDVLEELDIIDDIDLDINPSIDIEE